MDGESSPVHAIPTRSPGATPLANSVPRATPSRASQVRRRTSLRPRRAGPRADGTGTRPLRCAWAPKDRVRAPCQRTSEPRPRYSDLRYETLGSTASRNHQITAQVRNAFRPQTVIECAGLRSGGEDTSVGAISSTGEATSVSAPAATARCASTRPTRSSRRPGFRALQRHDLHVRSAACQAGVAMVAGTGRRRTTCLPTSCSGDLPSPPTTPASGRPGPRVGSFDCGAARALLAAQIGQEVRAKEIWFVLCRQYRRPAVRSTGARSTCGVVPSPRA